MTSIAPRCTLLALCVVFLAHSYEAFGEQTWTEIRSPHFRVITDASGRDARVIANEFEQMRHLLSQRLSVGRVDSPAQLTILAVSGEIAFRDLDPGVWKSTGGRISGEFVSGWEKEFAVVRLDLGKDLGQTVVFYDYTENVLSTNIRWLPTWVSKGMGEFYSYTRFQSGDVLVGAPSIRLPVLRTHPVLPVEEMVRGSRLPSLKKDPLSAEIYAAECWAMVHYMTFGPDMQNGEKLNRFIGLVRDQKSEEQAFHEVFGDYKSFDQNFSRYLLRFSFPAATVPPDPGIDSKTFQERKLTAAEADYELGSFHVRRNDRTAGRDLIEKSLTLDPKLAGAHEELGFLDFETGKDSAAEDEWKQAVALDPAMYRSLFALTMSGPSIAEQTPDQLKVTQATLRHVTEIDPTFPAAYADLALIEWRMNSMQQAYKDAHEAEKLAPARAGYHLLVGYILLHGSQAAIAAGYARYVAEHWRGSDHNEAVDLWDAVPAASRGEGAPLTLELPEGSEGATVARGRLLEVRCTSDPQAEKTSISFMPDGPPGSTPLQLTGPARLRVGFSDTLWWGRDHLSACHHLAGHAAVVAYKPEGSGGEIVDLEVRDDLPAKM